MVFFIHTPRGLADDGGPVCRIFAEKKGPVDWCVQDTSHELELSHGLRLLVSQGPFWTPYHPLKKSPQIRGKNCCAFITSWFFSLRIRAKQNHPPHSPHFSGLFKKKQEKNSRPTIFCKKCQQTESAFHWRSKVFIKLGCGPPPRMQSWPMKVYSGIRYSTHVNENLVLTSKQAGKSATTPAYSSTIIDVENGCISNIKLPFN